MTYETPTARSLELTRRQKIVKRLVPLVLGLTGIGAGVGYLAHESFQSEKEATPEVATGFDVTVTNSAEFAAGTEGWGLNTAENLILYSLGEAVAEKAATVEPSGEFDAAAVAEQLESVPVFEQAGKALDMAGYNDVLPDAGDELQISLDVNVGDDNDVSYEVSDAKIIDKDSH